jgi:hypothetical protein
MTPEVQAYHDLLAAQFSGRRCCHRRCNMPVVSVEAGQDAVRGPGGILVMRGRPDRNYCEVHGLLRRKQEIAA